MKVYLGEVIHPDAVALLEKHAQVVRPKDQSRQAYLVAIQDILLVAQCLVTRHPQQPQDVGMGAEAAIPNADAPLKTEHRGHFVVVGTL